MLIFTGIVLTSAALLLSVRAGTRPSLPFVGLAGLAAFFLLGPSFGLTPLMGWVAVYQMERGAGFGNAVAGALLPVAAFCLWLVFSSSDPQVLQQRSDLVSEQFQSLGLEMDPQVMEAMIYLVLRMQPSVEFISLLLSFLLAFRMAFLLAPRFGGIPFPEAPPMMLWRPWEELIWVMIGALGLSLLGVSWLADLALNVVVVMSVIYAAQGLAVLRFFSRRHGVPKALELPFYIALLLLPGLSIISLAFVGLLDTWFDWRRLRPASLEDENKDED